MMEAKSACVILNYNDAETTRKLVQQLEQIAFFDTIVIVDNASSDRSVEQLKQLQSSRVKLLCMEKNGGYGYGNNAGVRYAVETCKATHVLIANPDIMVSKQVLKRMLQVLLTHPETAVVSAWMHDRQYGDLCSGFRLHGFFGELLNMGPVSRRLFGKWLNYPKSCFEKKPAVYVDCVHGSMMMADAQKFLMCGGFDEGIFLYQEEAVLGQRIKNAGYRMVLLTKDHYEHEHSTSISKSLQSQMKRQRQREESVLYYMKHYLGVHRAGEIFAKLWFSMIRMEIFAAETVEKIIEKFTK